MDEQLRATKQKLPSDDPLNDFGYSTQQQSVISLSSTPSKKKEHVHKLNQETEVLFSDVTKPKERGNTATKSDEDIIITTGRHRLQYVNEPMPCGRKSLFHHRDLITPSVRHKRSNPNHSIISYRDDRNQIKSNPESSSEVRPNAQPASDTLSELKGKSVDSALDKQSTAPRRKLVSDEPLSGVGHNTQQQPSHAMLSKLDDATQGQNNDTLCNPESSFPRIPSYGSQALSNDSVLLSAVYCQQQTAQSMLPAPSNDSVQQNAGYSMSLVPTDKNDKLQERRSTDAIDTTTRSSSRPEINFEMHNQNSRGKIHQVPISDPLKPHPRTDTAQSANVHRRDYSQQLEQKTESIVDEANLHFTTHNNVTEKQRNKTTKTQSPLRELSNNQKTVMPEVRRNAEPASNTLTEAKEQSHSSVEGIFIANTPSPYHAITLGNITIDQPSTNQTKTVWLKGGDQFHARPQCEKSFTNFESLNAHIKIEQEGKKYKCGECTARFKHQTNLIHHRKAEHEGKRYPCSECSAEFKYKKDLKHHQEAEHEGKRYPCRECSAEFKYKKDLKHHQEAEHEGKRYPCSECSAEFKRKDILKRHQEAEHQGKRYPCSE